MDKEEAAAYALLCIAVIFGVVCSSYNIAHNKGYMHGANQVIEYYEATNEFPSKQWLEHFEETRFDDAEEILETLRPYN